MILLAVRPELRERFLPEALVAELATLAPVAVSPTPADLLAPGSLPLLADAEVLVTGWGTGRISPEVLAAAPRLRAVVHTAGSVRALVDKACYARGVAISSQAWANAVPVTEYTLAMILLAAKGTFRAQREYRSGRAAYDVQTRLASYGAYGCRVGVIGASVIGRGVLELLRPFDLDVALADPTVDSRVAAELGATLLTLDELMATSDVVSLHAPWWPSTEGMIGARELSLLRDGGTFINSARGALVDESALIAELRTGRIDAIVDTTWPEVPAPDSPLWDLPNLMLTPHIAGSAGRELRRLGESAVREVARVVRGESLHHPVELHRFDILA